MDIPIKKIIVVGLVLAAAYGAYRALCGGLEVDLADGRSVSGKDIRTPLTAELVHRGLNGNIVFVLALKDGSGMAVRRVNPQPDPPAIFIFDQDSRPVHKGAFRFG